MTIVETKSSKNLGQSIYLFAHVAKPTPAPVSPLHEVWADGRNIRRVDAISTFRTTLLLRARRQSSKVGRIANGGPLEILCVTFVACSAVVMRSEVACFAATDAAPVDKRLDLTGGHGAVRFGSGLAYAVVNRADVTAGSEV